MLNKILKIIFLLSLFNSLLIECQLIRCSNNPCKNAKRCIDQPNAFNGYLCECHDTWIGLNCDEKKDTSRIDDKVLRLNCRHNPCRNALRCEDRFDGYFCHCQDTWFGLNCDEKRGEALRIDEKRDNYNRLSCRNSPCRNGARCEDRSTTSIGYFCYCNDPWTGQNCDQPKSNLNNQYNNPYGNNYPNNNQFGNNYPNNNNQYGNSYPYNNQFGNNLSCRNSPCKNGAKCEDRSTTSIGYHCYCNDPWTGQNCDQHKSNLNNNQYGNSYPYSNQFGMHQSNNNLHGNNYPNNHYNPHSFPKANQPIIYYQPVSNPRPGPINYGHGYGPNNYPFNPNSYGMEYRDNQSFLLAIILGTVIPFVVISIIIIAIVCCCCRRKKRQSSVPIEVPSQRGGNTRVPLLNTKNQY